MANKSAVKVEHPRKLGVCGPISEAGPWEGEVNEGEEMAGLRYWRRGEVEIGWPWETVSQAAAQARPTAHLGVGDRKRKARCVRSLG